LSENICSIIPGKETETITFEYSYSHVNKSLTFINYYYSIVNSKNQYTYDETPEIDILYEASSLNIHHKDSHKMVEFWMILVNKTVGEIFNNNNIGCFRYHPKPFDNQMTFMNSYLKYYYNTTQFTHNITKSNNDPLFQYIYRDMMRKAIYRPSSLPHHHYALDLDNYLHFTSPIRRGADIINHILLKNISERRDKRIEEELINKINQNIFLYCDYLNDAEIIQLEVENIIKLEELYNNLANNVNKIIETTIINIQKNFIEVYIQEYDITKIVHISKLSNTILRFDEVNNILINNEKIFKLFQILYFKIVSVNKITKEFELDIYPI